MYEKIKSFLGRFDVVFAFVCIGFLAGIYTGWSAGKPTGSQDYSYKIKQLFDIARADLVAERIGLDNQRNDINRLRAIVESERAGFERERNLNRSDREDLRRLEFLIDDSIQKIRDSKDGLLDSRGTGRAGSGNLDN